MNADKLSFEISCIDLDKMTTKSVSSSVFSNPASLVHSIFNQVFSVLVRSSFHLSESTNYRGTMHNPGIAISLSHSLRS